MIENIESGDFYTSTKIFFIDVQAQTKYKKLTIFSLKLNK
jgi:hypothetical protein